MAMRRSNLDAPFADEGRDAALEKFYLRKGPPFVVTGMILARLLWRLLLLAAAVGLIVWMMAGRAK